MTDVRYEDFEVGDRVIVIEPETEEEKLNIEVFNAGWDSDMNGLGGSSAVIRSKSDPRSGRPTYNLEFDDGDRWYWDPAWMEPETPMPSVNAEDFESMF